MTAAVPVPDGKAGYMSPEQARGDDPRLRCDLSHRNDAKPATTMTKDERVTSMANAIGSGAVDVAITRI